MDVLQSVVLLVGFGARESYGIDLWKTNIERCDQELFPGERIILKANENIPHAIFLKGRLSVAQSSANIDVWDVRERCSCFQAKNINITPYHYASIQWIST